MEIPLSNTLPPYPTFVEGIRRAPDRGFTLSPAQTATALKNALRYIPKELHETLAPEFMEELRTRGRIYGYRYRPQGDLKAKPIDAYKGNCIEGKAFQCFLSSLPIIFRIQHYADVIRAFLIDNQIYQIL